MSLKEQILSDRHIFFDDLADIHTIDGNQISIIFEQDKTYFAMVESFEHVPLKDDPQLIDSYTYIVDSAKVDNGILRVDLKQMDLDYSITFQSLAITNDHGHTTKTWSDSPAVMAAIRQLTQEEKESESQMFVEGDYVVECWHVAGIATDMRLKTSNKIYEITGIDNVRNRNKWLKIRCKELI